MSKPFEQMTANFHPAVNILKNISKHPLNLRGLLVYLQCCHAATPKNFITTTTYNTSPDTPSTPIQSSSSMNTGIGINCFLLAIWQNLSTSSSSNPTPDQKKTCKCKSASMMLCKVRLVISV